jgi:hypothetical protein
MGGTGRTVLDTSITLSGTRVIDRELVIAEGRTLLLNDNAVLRGSSSTTGGGRLTALGTLAKGEGSGNAYLQYLDIGGNIQSRGGLLRLHGYSDGQGASIGGMSVSSLNGGGLLMESGTFNVAGQPLQIAADSTLQLSAGTVHLDGAQIAGAGTFLVSGGTLLVERRFGHHEPLHDDGRYAGRRGRLHDRQRFRLVGRHHVRRRTHRVVCRHDGDRRSGERLQVPASPA